MTTRRDDLPAHVEFEFPDSAWRQRLRRQLLRWFDAHARDVPWRPSPGLYGTWISEIMLQQTQVATVVPFYRRFLERFPDVQALATADEQEVLRHWEGLGYYRRARQLHAAARQIVTEHGGRIPTAIDQLRALPGIGRYTAGAILSIAVDQRHPVLEANTLRLLSRLLARTADPARGDSQRCLWAFAEALLPRRRCGDFNQALMELGSTLCTPRAPACAQCPLRSLCPTQARGLQDCIPPRRAKKSYVDVSEAAVVVRRADGRVLLRRCQPGERWSGLWDFPRLAWSGPEDAVATEQLCAEVATLAGGALTAPRLLATLRHGVTRHKITLTCFEAVCRRAGRARGDVRWVMLSEMSSYPMSVTGRRICRLLNEASSHVDAVK